MTEWTLVEHEEASEVGRLDMAAARLSVQTLTVLNKAVESSGISRRTLAEKIGVSEGRVSQVLNGNGNLQAATVARFLRAVGYQAQLMAVPCDEGVPPLPSPKRGARRSRRRRQRGGWVYQYNLEGTTILPDSVGPTEVVAYGDVHPESFVGSLQISSEKKPTIEAAIVASEEGVGV